jgi:hypothetical protein
MEPSHRPRRREPFTLGNAILPSRRLQQMKTEGKVTTNHWIIRTINPHDSVTHQAINITNLTTRRKLVTPFRNDLTWDPIFDLLSVSEILRNVVYASPVTTAANG